MPSTPIRAIARNDRPTDLLASLNEAQRAAAEHGAGDPEGPAPLLVIARRGLRQDQHARPPGRASHPQRRRPQAHHARDLLAPRRRRSSTGASQRLLQRALAPRTPRRSRRRPMPAPSIRIGARLLREYARAASASTRNFTIHDREDSADLMNWARHAAGFRRRPERFPDQGDLPGHLFARRQRARAASDDAGAGVSPGPPRTRRRCAGCSPPMSRPSSARSVLDYDDLLLYFAQMLAEPGSPARSPARFDHLLVDEYQDTNRCRPRSRWRCARAGAGLTVVGDDAQSIYSFRAATVRNILDFPDTFDPPARDRHARAQLPLDAADPRRLQRGDRARRRALRQEPLDRARRAARSRSWSRSPTRPIRRASSPRACWTIARRARRLKSQAVLFRASHHSAALELELTRRNIPFVKFGGLKFLDAAHIKDALALLRFAENPRDRIAGFRVAQLLPGIGPASAEKIVAAAGGDDSFAALRRLCAAGQGAARLRRIRRRFCARLARGAPWPADLGEAVAWRRAASGGRLRQCRAARGRPRRARAHRRDLSFARAFPRAS